MRLLERQEKLTYDALARLARDGRAVKHGGPPSADTI
jgi:hypothetical protein